MSTKKHILISFPIVLVTVVIDQVTKFLFTEKIFIVLDGVVSVYYSENTGAAWSIFSGKVIMLAILSVFFLFFLIFISHKFKEKNSLYSVGYAFIIGGAFGNLIDRVFLGFVRDFIKLEFMSFPIFNFADTFLVIGVLIFCFFILFFKQEDEKKEK